MRPRLALLVVPLLLVSLLPAAAAAAPPSGPPSLPDAAVQHRAAVLAYWTPARMAAAIPRDVVLTGVGVQPVGKPAVKPTRPPKPTPTPTPNPTPTPTPSDGTTIGSSWTGGGIMLTATGKVYFSMGGSNWICSGSVITDNKTGRSIVLTAGHCVVDNDGTFASDWMFIPAFDLHPTYDCESTEYGCWVADALYADEEFASAGSFNDTAVRHDWGFAVVGGGGWTETDTFELDATAGSLGITYPQYFGQTVSAFGYPAALKYKGNDLVYCRGVVGTDPNTDNTTWSLPCNMTGGSSGGPWVRAGDTTSYADAEVGSLNSYGYSTVKNVMFGPKFNSDTKNVFDAANNGTLSSGVARQLLP